MKRPDETDFVCPVCEHEDIFDKFVHNQIYVIGSLMLEENRDGALNEFINASLSSCRTYLKSKKEKENEYLNQGCKL